MSLSKTLDALAEPNRLKVLELLKKRRLSVSEIALHLAITMPTLSHHLDILKRADLVAAERSGQQIFYSLNLSVFEEAVEQLIKFLKIKRKGKYEV